MRGGQIGAKEIERLIQKLEVDKEILAEQEEATAQDAPDPDKSFRRL